MDSTRSALANQKYLIPTANRPDLVMERGQGSWLEDSEGNRYLDFVQGWAVNTFGHAPPRIREALAQQAEKLWTASPAFHNGPQLALCAGLARHSGLSRVFLCSSGAEANEGAIKLARKWGAVARGGAHEVITTHGSFHGRTLATMAASGRPGWEGMFAPGMAGFTKVPFGDVTAVAAAIGPQTVAVMVEPIQGEAGVVCPPDGYLRGLRELTRERGVLLILDEIQTGMGRTGRLFAHQWEDARPDILSLGKGLGAGVPLAAVLSSQDACRLEPGEQGGTYAGNPLMAAVGVAVLEDLTAPGFLETVRERGQALGAVLEGICAAIPGARVLGRGLLRGVELPVPVAVEAAAACRDEGLLVNAPQPTRLRFMPALNIESDEIEALGARLGPVLACV